MVTRLILGSILATGLIVFTACSSSDSGTGGNDAGAAETSTTIDSGNGGSGGGTVPTGGACDGTAQGASTCTGGLCLGLNENKQGKDGICTEPCSQTVACSAGTTCVNFPSLGLLCLKDCQTNADCTDGFICLPGDAEGDTKFCLVEVNGTDGGTDAGADAADAGGDYCKAQDCDIIADPKGYCDNNAAAKRVCDCPSGKTPNAACTAATTGANLWCCPAAP